MFRAALTLAFGLICGSAAQAQPLLTVWAWERPEDLRFLPENVEIAVHSGFIELRGDDLIARPRRFPLLAQARQVTTAVVHLQVDHRRRLDWTPRLRARTAAAVVRLSQGAEVRRVQIDFEVRASERGALNDVLTDVRSMLPPSTELVMTALASWCANEDWLDGLPVNEIAPMLFRMGSGGAKIRSELARGGDFSVGSCRKAVAVSVDAPVPRAPGDRRVYLFSPKPWSQNDFSRVAHQIDAWRTSSATSR